MNCLVITDFSKRQEFELFAALKTPGGMERGDTFPNRLRAPEEYISSPVGSRVESQPTTCFGTF